MAASPKIFTVPVPMPGQAPFRRAVLPQLDAAAEYYKLKFSSPGRDIYGYFRLMWISVFFSTSAVVANRSFGIEVVHWNEVTGADGMPYAIVTNDVAASKWGKITLTQGGALNNVVLLNHGQGGSGQVGRDIILADEDYIRMECYNCQAGDVIICSYCFEYLNNLYGINKPG